MSEVRGGIDVADPPAEDALRLLLIEADPDDAALVAAKLTALGGTYTIEHHDSLASALPRLQEEEFDLVLLDLGLPDSQGLDTYRRLSGVEPSTPTVILTGVDDTELAVEAIRLGAQDYVPKSASSGELLHRVIRHAIERAEVERLRRADRDLFEALLSNTLDGVRVMDRSGTITYVQRLAHDFETTAVIGRRNRDFIHPEDVASWDDAFAQLVTEGSGARAELRVRCRFPSGYRWVEFRLANLLDNATVQGIVANSRDVTERQDREQRLRHQATHDPLTGLPNRMLLADRLEHALARIERTGESLGVLFVDLDHFKVINDTNGHHVGDQVLLSVATCLQRAIRQSDTLARIGGDEFIVLVEDCVGAEGVVNVARRLQAKLRAEAELGQTRFFPTASIGVATTTGGDVDAAALMRNADAAMYQAKQNGRDCIAVFDVSLERRLRNQVRIDRNFRVGIDEDESVAVPHR